MLYTIGYQRLTPQRLAQFVDALQALLVDCRHKPSSRIAGFGRYQLEQRFGMRYAWRGSILGGSGNTTSEGFRYLREVSRGDGNLLLMCMEEAPGDCHRHHDICARHFPDAIHIFQDELFTARALQAAIDQGGDYEISGDVADIISR
jgi:uncharacterized protein (DUF488 family)